MGPFEYFWFLVFVFFIFIALVRGYNRELGATTMIFVALFLITYLLEPRLPTIVSKSYRQVMKASLSPRQLDNYLANLYSVTFIAIIFASYAGETFSLKGKPAPGWRGAVYNILIGAVNGYLVAGTLWYFQDKFHYPSASLGILNLPLTQMGEHLANFLPPYVIPPIFWAVLVTIMLLFRVKN